MRCKCCKCKSINFFSKWWNHTFSLYRFMIQTFECVRYYLSQAGDIVPLFWTLFVSSPSDGCIFIETAQLLTIMSTKESSGTFELDIRFSRWRKNCLVCLWSISSVGIGCVVANGSPPLGPRFLIVQCCIKMPYILLSKEEKWEADWKTRRYNAL